MVARGMGEEAVAPGEDLRLLFNAVGRGSSLRRPRHVEHAREPGAVIDRVDHELAHQHVGEAVAGDRAGVVVRR